MENAVHIEHGEIMIAIKFNGNFCSGVLVFLPIYILCNRVSTARSSNKTSETL